MDSDSSSSHETSSLDGDTKDNCKMFCCDFPENGVDLWIACDTCNRWFHIHCTSIDLDYNLNELEWECCDCSFS